MLIQLDGSFHPWLRNQIPAFTLLIAVDDATGTVANALFCEKEEAFTCFRLVQQHAGIPVALYVDRHGVFRHAPGTGLPGTATQLSRAMDELGRKDNQRRLTSFELKRYSRMRDVVRGTLFHL